MLVLFAIFKKLVAFFNSIVRGCVFAENSKSRHHQDDFCKNYGKYNSTTHVYTLHILNVHHLPSLLYSVKVLMDQNHHNHKYQKHYPRSIESAQSNLRRPYPDSTGHKHIVIELTNPHWRSFFDDVCSCYQFKSAAETNRIGRRLIERKWLKWWESDKMISIYAFIKNWNK